MKKMLLGFGLLFAVLVAVGLVFQAPLREAVEDWQTRDMFVPAVAADPQLGPEPGTSMPSLNAIQMGRTVNQLQEYARGNGTVLVVLRSVDWCIYCKRQLVQLQAYQHHFQAAGIGLVAITYDMPDLQRQFIEQHSITIPLLSDIEQGSFRALGILNEEYVPGDSEYGIPHPGLVVVDREGVIAGKLFVPAFQLRVDSSEALQYARDVLGLKTPFG